MMNTKPLTKMRSIDALETWPQNYRQGDVDRIATSLARFGFNGALRVRGAVVMAGNQTLLALRKLREQGAEPPANVSARWEVLTLSVDHLSEHEATAFAIADNRTHDLGHDDEEALRGLLDHLTFDKGLFEATGFDQADLEAMAKAATQPDPANKELDLGAPTTFGHKCPQCGFEWKD